MDKMVFIDLINKGYSTNGIARELKLGQTTVRYWLKKFALKTNFNKYNKKLRPPKPSGHICKFCDKKFIRGVSLGGHAKLCTANPNRKLNLDKQHLAQSKVVQNWTRERREKQSVLRSKIIQELGVGGFKNVKTYKVICNATSVFYNLRGTWEKQVAHILNILNIEWQNKMYLNYYDGDINRIYCPDFYLPEHGIYLEVKGYFKEKDKLKMRMVKDQNVLKIFMIKKNIMKILDRITALDDLLKDEFV